MIEIKELEKLKVKFIGTDYELTKPNRLTVRAWQDKIKAKKDDGLDAIAECLVDAGLPQDVTDQLQIEHIGQIFEALVGAQKKK